MNSLFDRIVEIARRRNKVVRVLTHDGHFHLDDALSVATIAYFCRKADVVMDLVRSRGIDPAEADVCIDVGLEYNPASLRFDHHQKGGAGRRIPRILPSGEQQKGVSYSAIGLIWKHFGSEFVELVVSHETELRLSQKQIEAIARHIDKILIEGICALDTGDLQALPSSNVNIQSFSAIVARLNPNWIEFNQGSESVSEKQLRMFQDALPFVTSVLIGFVLQSADFQRYRLEVIKEIMNTTDGILVLNTPTSAWRPFVKTHPHIQLVVQPQMDDGNWGVHAIQTDDENSAKYCCALPGELTALTEPMFKAHTGVGGVMYVHGNGFFAATTNKKSAIQLARYAIEKSARTKD
jgi:uncharacterized UPF0160 family protein